MVSVTGSRRLASASAVNAHPNGNVACDREGESARSVARLWRFAVGCAAVAALAACSQPDASVPVGSANATTAVAVDQMQSERGNVTPAPTVVLTASPTTISSHASSSMTWTTTYATDCWASGSWQGQGEVPTSGTESTGNLSTTTEYSLTCNGPGGTATQTATVTVAALPPAVWIQASPSTVSSGGSASLTWSSQNANSCSASGAWLGNQNASGTQSTGPLTASSVYTLTCTGNDGSATQLTTVSVTPPAHTAVLTASPRTIASGNSAASKVTGGNAGESAMVSASSSTPAPWVRLTADPSSIPKGSSSELRWTTTNATSCTASGGWSGSKRAGGGAASTGAVTGNTTYTLTCAGAGGSAAQSTTITVSSATPAVTLSANPTTVTSGHTSTLTWSSTNATSCTASGGWSGSELTIGSESTSGLLATTKYTLACAGTGGTASQSVTVTVPAVPIVSLSASPTSIASGGSSTMTWSSTNATSCTASGGTSGALATSGSQTTGALSATTTYTLSCTGSGGSASHSATVTVTPAATGAVTLSWVPPTTNSNGTPVTPLTGYTIYYGKSASSLTQSIVVSGESTTSYTVTGIASGTWYFALDADASDGTQSALSNVASRTI